MTILSKVLSEVKTLIEYAKCSIYCIEQYYGRNAEMYLPKALDPFNPTTTTFFIKNNNKITALRGSITSLGTGSYGCQAAANLVEVDLPKLHTITGNYMWQNCGSLKTVKFKSLANVTNTCLFDKCSNLEYIEFGTLEIMSNTALQGCTSYKMVVVGKGTRCNLFLYHSKELTQECLHGIIDAFEDRNGRSALTLHIYDVCAQRISDEYKQKAADKNINILEVKSQ